MSIAELIISIANKVKGIKDNVLAAYEIIENAGFDTKNKKVEELPSVVSKAINKATMISRGGELGNRTLFIDFDGTPLFAYEPEEIQALEELPIPYTSHERLTFVKWNYTLEQIKEEVITSGWVDVGALYVPTDGWGEMEIEIGGPIPQYTPHFRMWLQTDGVLTIDWGDGTPLDEYNGKDFDVKHTYSNVGRYLVKFNGTTPFYGIYTYNDTRVLVCGRFVFPANSKGIGLNHEGNGKSGGNNPVENNSSYSDPQCLANTRIETLVLPSPLGVEAGNCGSGLTHMPCLKSIVCDNVGEWIWRVSDISFPSVKFFSIPVKYQSFGNVTTAQFVGAKSMKFTRPMLGIHSGQTTYTNLERMCLPTQIRLDVTHPVHLPLIRSLEGYTWGSLGMFWTTGGIINMRYCKHFPKPAEEGKLAYFISLNGNIAIKDYDQVFTIGSGNNFPTFSSNYSLQTVSLQCGGTRTMKASSFANDYHLKEVHLLYADPSTNGTIVTLANVNAFSGCPSDLKIYVPAELVDAYKTATNWSTYADQIFAEPEVEPTE